jgi:hypothetical protein
MIERLAVWEGHQRVPEVNEIVRSLIPGELLTLKG